MQRAPTDARRDPHSTPHACSTDAMSTARARRSRYVARHRESCSPAGVNADGGDSPHRLWRWPHDWSPWIGTRLSGTWSSVAGTHTSSGAVPSSFGARTARRSRAVPRRRTPTSIDQWHSGSFVIVENGAAGRHHRRRRLPCILFNFRGDRAGRAEPPRSTKDESCDALRPRATPSGRRSSPA